MARPAAEMSLYHSLDLVVLARTVAVQQVLRIKDCWQVAPITLMTDLMLLLFPNHEESLAEDSASHLPVPNPGRFPGSL
jgi:hypothetical protein